jgi:hypothetical protein
MKVYESINLPRRQQDKNGEVGIEIEMEGHRINQIQPDKYWHATHDGSLRGDSVEFVLKQPATRLGVPPRLAYLGNLLKKKEINFEDSGRAGVHVHVNCQDLQMREVYQFLTMYLIFENMLVHWCGEGRENNLFCLRTQDAPALLHTLRMVAKDHDWHFFATDEHRYASVNLKALTTYGSLEFRAMRSTNDMSQIQAWVNILLKIKDACLDYGGPHEIVEALSFESTRGFFDRILGDTPVQYNHRDMMVGVRHAQFIAYAEMDWDLDEVHVYLEEEEEVERPAPDFKKWAMPDADHRALRDKILDRALRARGPGAVLRVDDEGNLEMEPDEEEERGDWGDDDE